MITIVKQAVEKAGGVMALARALDIKNHQTLYGWRRVPPEYVLKIAEITETPASDIDPVLYPPHLFNTNKDAATA